MIRAPPEANGAERLLPRKGARYIDWANLLRRGFLLDLACGCGGTRWVIASIEDGSTARRILRHLGLSDEPPRLEPVRLEQPPLWPTGPPQDEAEPAPPDDWDQRPRHDDLFFL